MCCKGNTAVLLYVRTNNVAVLAYICRLNSTKCASQQANKQPLVANMGGAITATAAAPPSVDYSTAYHKDVYVAAVRWPMLLCWGIVVALTWGPYELCAVTLRIFPSLSDLFLPLPSGSCLLCAA